MFGFSLVVVLVVCVIFLLHVVVTLCYMLFLQVFPWFWILVRLLMARLWIASFSPLACGSYVSCLSVIIWLLAGLLAFLLLVCCSCVCLFAVCLLQAPFLFDVLLWLSLLLLLLCCP